MGRSLNVTQTAELLGVSTNTVRRYADVGVLPVMRLPTGARRFEAADVLELRFKIRRQENAAEPAGRA